MSTAFIAGNAAAWPDHSYMERCGEIFITPSYTVFVHCTLCDQRHQVYSQFLEHIFACHFADVEEAAVISAQTVQDEDRCLYNESSEDCVNPESFVDENITDDEDLVFIKDLSDTTSLLQKLQERSESVSTAKDCAAPTSSSSPQQLKNATPTVSRRPNHRGRTADTSNHKYKCTTCGLTFKEAFNWRAHCRRHTEKKRFVCPQCNKAFHTRSEQVIHLRRHNGERPYVCTYCGQGFVTHGSMMLHEKRHRNFRPHKCETCGQTFFDAYQLREHAVKHTGERNFVCSECDATFLHRRNLRVHMKLHVNAREYVCNLCDKAFNQKPALFLHRKNKHKLVSSNSSSVKIDNEDS